MSRLPTLRPRQLIAGLKKAGFAEHHQTGSHLSLVHPNGRRVIVPVHAQDLPRGTVNAILHQAGITEEQFRELL